MGDSDYSDYVVAEKEPLTREAYAETVSVHYDNTQAKWDGVDEAEKRRTVMKRGLRVAMAMGLAVSAILLSSVVAGGGRGKEQRTPFSQSDDLPGLFSATDDDCDKYEGSEKYTAESCALWDEYQCDMACSEGTTCAYLCGEACSKGEGAICGLNAVRLLVTRFRKILCISSP